MTLLIFVVFICHWLACALILVRLGSIQIHTPHANQSQPERKQDMHGIAQVSTVVVSYGEDQSFFVSHRFCLAPLPLHRSTSKPTTVRHDDSLRRVKKAMPACTAELCIGLSRRLPPSVLPLFHTQPPTPPPPHTHTHSPEP